MSGSRRSYEVKPIPNPRLWGTDRLASLVHLPTTDAIFGEIFMASSMENAECEIDGRPFNEFYQMHPDYFNLKEKRFPLRVNLIDTSLPLSIQVHPGSEITTKLGYPQGVHEFWVILEAKPGATIELGHRFTDKEQMERIITNNQIDSYCIDRSVHKGETFHLHPGTMHAIGAGMLIYELTYNLDFTYRIHDYDRVDPTTGKPRKLHLEDAMSVIAFPQTALCGFIEEKRVNQFDETILIDETGIFTLKQWKIKGDVTLPIDTFFICTIIEGTGWIDDQPVRQFETRFIPATVKTLNVIGEMTILAATYREGGEL